jgi:hypothetical protein
MIKKRNYQGKLIVVVMVLVHFLTLKYHNTDAFQASMKFLFNPDASLALPIYWQENRMLFLGALVVALFLCYLPVWSSYKNLIQIYRHSPEKKSKPSLSALQGSYFYRQNKTMCLLTWLIDLCRRNALSLHYEKGVYPWSVSRVPRSKGSLFEQQLLDILFQEKDQIPLKASFSDPEPNVKEVAEKLYVFIKAENSHFFQPQKSSLLAWLVLFGLVAEIPFFVAGQASMTPGTLVFTLFSATIISGPIYVFCDELPLFFSELKIISYFKLIAASMFVLFGQWLLFTSNVAASYWATALYPNLVVVLIVMVHKVPFLPKSNFMLSQIIGYQKYLGHDGYQIKEEDLPWTMGLGVHTDIIANPLCYGEQEMPEWIQTNEDDVQFLVKTLHQTLGPHLSKAINGEMKSKKDLSRSRNNRGF